MSTYEEFETLFSDPDQVPHDRDTARTVYPPLNALTDTDVDLLLTDFHVAHNPHDHDDAEDLNDLLYSWYATIEIMNDPDLRNILTGHPEHPTD